MQQEERKKYALSELQKEFGPARELGGVRGVPAMLEKVRELRDNFYKRHNLPSESPSCSVGKQHHGGKIVLSNPPKTRGIQRIYDGEF